MPDDKVLLQVARLGIETLIEKYRDTKGGQFFLLHRPRQWNPNEKSGWVTNGSEGNS